VDREVVTIVASVQALLLEGESFSFVIDFFSFCFLALDIFPVDPVEVFPVDPLDFFPPFFDPFTLRSTLTIASVSWRLGITHTMQMSVKIICRLTYENLPINMVIPKTGR
jgi:hypothetical protein